MRLLIIVALVTAAVAQPAVTTTHKPSFFSSLSNIFQETIGALGDSLTSYLHNMGDTLLHQALPNLAGQLLVEGFGSLVNVTHGKRNVAADLQSLRTFATVVEEAKLKASGLVLGLKTLANNYYNGKVTKEKYLEIIANLRTDFQNILHGMTSGLLQEVSKMTSGSKRDISQLVSGMVDMLHHVESQGLALFGQVEQVLTTLTNPENILSLLGQLSLSAQH